MSARFRVSAEQFAVLDKYVLDQTRAAGKRPPGEKMREIARAAIVEGQAHAEIAAQMGCTKQHVGSVVKRYFQAYLSRDDAAWAKTSGGVTISWIGYGFELPSQLVEPMEALLKKIKKHQDIKQSVAAIRAVIKAIETQITKLD